MHVNSLGLVAAQVAFSGECDEWLEALRLYLTGNRDFLVASIQDEVFRDQDDRPGMPPTWPGWTAPGWSASGKIGATPHEFFLKQAKVALNEGREFGPGGEGFVRLNFGCPRTTLVEALGKNENGAARIIRLINYQALLRRNDGYPVSR